MEIKDMSAVRVSLASPEQIRSWSYGEVLKPETINYRRLRPERDGLFDERIFGPTRDWECYCGKYKKVRYKGMICEKCGVEVAPARVRRERMGHIELAAPVAHVWYTRRVPSYLGLLLDVSRRNLDRVLYFAQYMITDVDEEARKRAIRRLEEDLKHKIDRETKAANDKIAGKELAHEEEIEKLEKKTDTAVTRLEEQLNAQMDQVVSAGKTLERRLDEVGRQVRKAIVFDPTGDTIVAEGDEITSKHKKKLRDVVEAHLAGIEKEIRLKQKDKKLLLSAERDQKKHALEEESNAVREQCEGRTAALKRELEPKLEELNAIRVKEFLGEARFRELNERWGSVFKVRMGAEAVYELLKRIDLTVMARELRHEIRSTRSKQQRKKAIKQLRVVEALRKSNNRPEWMVLTVLPVIPPDLRPMVQLDGGRFATSDLNDLYRRVINRNNRLKRLLELGAPEVIVNNEKRMLQEAVDSLIDNAQKGKAVSARGQRKLKSLSDLLKGKQGRFRRNLLGKRVDYSGRSVIVVGPHLKLNQCGLPKSMALELFKPFVMRKLVEYNYAHNIKSAKRLVDRSSAEVWDVLEEIIKDHPVLLNRAPTLHRLGIQAFEVILVEGSAIQIHPLVCAAFNADFDGDQMAVHVPLSEAAKEEARRLMLSSHNLLKPASGEPIVEPTKDMVLGVYYLTMDHPGEKGEGKVFSSPDEVALAYDLGHVALHAKIKVVLDGKTGRLARKGDLIETTVGRVLFNEIVPPELRYVNDALDKGRLKDLVAAVYAKLGPEGTAEVVDRIKEIGFKYATRSGLTIAIDDITVPLEKQVILNRVTGQVNEVEQQYRRGLITEDEQYVKTVELWTEATDEITEAVRKEMAPESPIRVMANSGATKGGFQPIRQLAGMRGLMADPAGRIIALPIKSNFREGLTALEYFISTHGARKGLADTALRTADAGYLTRRLVDVAQEVIINEEDCGTMNGIWIDAASKERTGENFSERVVGRVTATSIAHPKTGEVLVPAGEMITEEAWPSIAAAKIDRIHVRSALTCEARHGMCAKCYGRDLARGGLIRPGEAVGIIAAQSIGEPGTQLTLRTFHTGGVAGVEDITNGLPRVEELFEARDPKGEALMAEMDGNVELYTEGDERRMRVVNERIEQDEYELARGVKAVVNDGDEVEEGDTIAEGPDGEIAATNDGKAIVEKGKIIIRRDVREEKEYDLPAAARLRVEEGQHVKSGDQLTEGSKNPREILRILGIEATQMYLLDEVQRVYRSQGVNINDKHIEIIISQMLRRVRVRTSGATDLLPGEILDRKAFEARNKQSIEAGGNPATGSPIILGLTRSALATESFLAAASFQETTRVLTDAAVRGRVDHLRGLKENVILGKLIPVGSGFRERTDEIELGPTPTVTVDDITEEPATAAA